MPPRMDGFAVCRTLRQESAVPIITSAGLSTSMLSARSHEMDRVKGLEIGADDYIVKPFTVRELLARVRALLRQRELDRGQPSPTSGRIVVGDIVLDCTAHQVWRASRPLPIPRRHARALLTLDELLGFLRWQVEEPE